MIKSLLLSCAAVGVLVVGVTGDDTKADKFDAKCPISGAKADKTKTVDFNGGKVYVCCGKCQAAFKKDSKKYVAKANHQLVYTKQAVQKKCPISGGKMKDGTDVKIGGVAVKFCCNNCKGKAESKKGNDQIVLAFSETAFKKGFEVKKPKKKFDAKCPISGAAAKEAHAVAYNGGKVYVCCGKCEAAFKKDSTKFTLKANHQLVHTGQAVQTKCPISGGKMKDGTDVKIGGVAVKFCCNNCKGKAAGAKGDDQLKLAFSGKAFKKGFEIKKADKK